MITKRVSLLFLSGVLLIGIGFFIGRLSKENPIIESYSLSERIISRTASILGERSVAEVKITKIFDGDTVETETGEKIRYLGINAPEKGEPFFEEATKFNESLVLRKNVVLELDAEKNDRYRRTIAYVFVSDKLVNLEMVKSGWAVLQTIPPNVRYQDKLVAAQNESKEKCLGLWAGLCKDGVKISNDSSSCVKISSIYADASGNDNENKNGEWIEITSSCLESVSLNGWLLKDSSASNRYRFKDFSLDRGQSVIIYSGCSQDSEDRLYWQCPDGKYAIWNNSGDHAFLYNDKGKLSADYQY